MRSWLLLVSLLVSDQRPLGVGDPVVEKYSWSLYRKLLLDGQMSPRGPEILHMCIQRNCVQLRQRTSHFHRVSTVLHGHGCSLSHQDFTGIIQRSRVPALVVLLFHEEERSVPVFLVKSGPLPAPHVISEITQTGHMSMHIIKDHPDSGSAWFLHHHTAASGHSFPAFSLQKSRSWTSATIVQLQKMLTKRCCVIIPAIISCWFNEAGIRSTLNIKNTSKQQMIQPQIRETESTQPAMDGKVLMENNGQQPSKALVSQQDIFQAASLRSGSSSVKTSDASHLEIQRKAARIMKKNEHLNLDEESLLQRNVQRQNSLKAASSVYDEDGFYNQRPLLLVSREKPESINRPEYKMKAAQDDNKKDFSAKIITKQAEFRRPGGESETEQSHANTIENGNRERSAYIRRADFVHKADNDDVDHKQTLIRAAEEVLIMLFLPDRETQTEALSQRKLILNTDTGWETVNIPIKELDDPPPTTEVLKENFFIEPRNSECKCLRESTFSLDIYDRRERMDLKPAESAATTESADTEVKETREKTEDREKTSHENKSISHNEPEENVPRERSVTTSPPSVKMMETEAAKTECVAEKTTVNMEIKETTSSAEVFDQGSTLKTDELPSAEETPTTTASPESETDTEPGFLTNNNTQTTSQRSFSGLRMREDIPADATELHEGRATTKRPATERKEDQNRPRVNSFTFAKPSQTIHKEAPDEPPKTTGDNTPPCRGLIHRTEAGWKHCVERFEGVGSKKFSSWDEFKDAGEQEHTSVREHADELNDDEYDHFYYFDGILRRVRNNFYPYYKRQRRQREKRAFTVRERGDTRENLLSYIRRLALRNKAIK